MMRLARRASLLAALSLLTSAATAYAECAWVLWRETTTFESGVSRGTEWISDGHATSRECYADYDRRVERMLKSRWRSAGTDLYASPSIEGSSMQLVTRFRCLPDTVDPRGPKGK
jgi:hypothetical protein